MSSLGVTVADVVAAIDASYPFEWAESWDAVGLRAGDPSMPVSGVLVSLDPTGEAVARAKAAGANVLVTHHPPALEMPATLTPSGAAGVIYTAVADGVALIAAHTNVDRGPDAAGCLLERLGFGPGEPLEKGTQTMRHIAVFCPIEAAPAVRDAMAAAGAGRVGLYRACSFETQGTGRFEAAESAQPALGSPGASNVAEECRIESVCAPSTEGRVLAAIRSVHPYEEPLIVVADAAISRGAARMGRIAELEPALTLAELATRVSEAFACTPTVWGAPDTRVTTLATGTGSVGSLVGQAVARGADALLGGEVRYHDALSAVARGLAVIEAGHDVTEWPLVPYLARAVRSTPGLDPALVYEDAPARRWWTP